MTQFAARTTVSSDDSRKEIELLLVRYGADQFVSGWTNEASMIGCRLQGRHVRFVLPMPDRNDRKFTHSGRGQREPHVAAKAWEQAIRQRWRALVLIIKAKFEAIDSGISIFDDEFLANIVLPGDQTAGDWLRPQVAEAYRIGTMPAVLPMLPAPEKPHG